MKLTICLILLPVLALSQTSLSNTDLARLRADIAIQTISEKGMRVDASWMTVPLAPPSTTGSTYLEEKFAKGSVTLLEGSRIIANYRMRYDVNSDLMEFETSDGIRALMGNKIKSFILLDTTTARYRHFVRCSLLEAPQARTLTGFVEVLTDGGVPLLKRSVLFFRRANYRPELNMGNRDNQILKKAQYFAFFPGQLIELPSGRKNFYEVFGEYGKVLRDYAVDNYLSKRDEADLVRIFSHYNSLIAEP